jgi:hypothetical protein
MRTRNGEESVEFNTLRMHAVCKHKYMKNIQMKRTLKILGGENEKKGISYHPKKEILTVKEERKIIKNVTNEKGERK